VNRLRLERYLLPVRSNQTIRRVLRRSLENHVAERTLAATRQRVVFPAAHHLGLYFARWIQYEPELTRHLGEWMPRDGVALDIGANIGIYTLLLSHFAGPGGSVFAFEPDPQSLPWLQRNVDMNAIANVHVCPCAIGDESGHLTLYQDVTTTRTSSLVPNAWTPDAVDRRSVSVRVETLDDYADKVRRIDFVKIDTEGFECAVLRGGMSLLRRFSPKVLIEVLPANRLEVQGLLANLGYRFCDPSTGAQVERERWPSNVLCVPA
jgi:FkbM family methyltransferase